jgi:hypothetical protein
MARPFFGYRHPITTASSNGTHTSVTPWNCWAGKSSWRATRKGTVKAGPFVFRGLALKGSRVRRAERVFPLDDGGNVRPLQVGSVRLTGAFLRPGDFGLMRVLSFDGEHFIADSPYLLKASDSS